MTLTYSALGAVAGAVGGAAGLVLTGVEGVLSLALGVALVAAGALACAGRRGGVGQGGDRRGGSERGVHQGSHAPKPATAGSADADRGPWGRPGQGAGAGQEAVAWARSQAP